MLKGFLFMLGAVGCLVLIGCMLLSVMLILKWLSERDYKKNGLKNITGDKKCAR